jgi:hypothetical protein
VWDEGITFRDAVLKDSEITGTLSARAIDEALSLERSLRNVDRVFERLSLDAAKVREKALAR